MKEKSEFRYSASVIRVPIFTVFFIWLIYWLEYKFEVNFSNYGIYPRTLKGLRGIFFSPFIHGGIDHLVNNTIPIALFLGMAFFFYKEIAFKLLVYGGLLTGLLTWIIGGKAYHIGMSGIIYLLFSFIFFSGVLRKHFRLIAVSLSIIFLYGSMFWYVFPIKKGVSWEGHLSGLLIGALFAVVYRKVGAQKKAYEFSKTAFDLLFDEEGNFNPPSVEEEESINN